MANCRASLQRGQLIVQCPYRGLEHLAMRGRAGGGEVGEGAGAGELEGAAASLAGGGFGRNRSGVGCGRLFAVGRSVCNKHKIVYSLRANNDAR